MESEMPIINQGQGIITTINADRKSGGDGRDDAGSSQEDILYIEQERTMSLGRGIRRKTTVEVVTSHVNDHDR